MIAIHIFVHVFVQVPVVHMICRLTPLLVREAVLSYREIWRRNVQFLKFL